MAILRGALTNLGKYNEGELDYTWLSFPASKSDIDKAMKKIGIGEVNEVGVPYEEWFFTDWDSDESWVDTSSLGEYEDIDDVNDLAEKLEEIEENDLGDALEAAVEMFGDFDQALDHVEDMIYIDDQNLSDTDEIIGWHYFDELGINNIKDPERYFDYDAFGRDIRLEYYPSDEDDPETAGEYWCGDENATDEEIGEAVVDDLGWEGVGKDNIERYFDQEAFGRDIRIDGRFIRTDKGVFEYVGESRKHRRESIRRNLHGRNLRGRKYESRRKIHRVVRESAVYSQDYARRAKELSGLRDQDLFDALKPGDILEGSWGYGRTITDYFIIKRKTAKRIIVHEIARKQGNQSGDSYGGWSVCPVLPAKEISGKGDIQCSVSGTYVRKADYPKYLSVWDGSYGWENYD